MYKKTCLRLKRSSLRILPLLVCLCTGSLFAQSEIWVGSWSCAPYAAGAGKTPPSPYLANNTLRQVVRVSIGGDTLRLKFSNKTSATPVTMKAVNIAVSTGGSTIDESTITTLKFKDSASATLEPFSSVTSDPVAFPLTPGMRIAISIYYGEVASTPGITSHVASRTDSYILAGDQLSSIDFKGSVVTAHWFHIHAIEVQAPDSAGCVGVLGNSITDGYGLSGGLQNRWTDIFSEQLLSNPATQQVGVLNLGIGATNVAGSGATTGISRYKDDFFSQKGLRWIIIFYGVNDIGGGATAETITDAYQTIIDDAHARNIKVYGATVTPFKGHGYYSEAREEVRNIVNEWIRTPGNFDACIDFDRAIRDPQDTAKIQDQYSKDWLHPNVAGYEFLGKSVDLNLFTEVKNQDILLADAGSDQTVLDYGNSKGRSVVLDGSASFDFGQDIASYTWRAGDSIIATGERPVMLLPMGSHTLVLTVSDEEGNTAIDTVIVSIVNDSGIWLEAECCIVGSLWDIVGDENASNNLFVTVKPGNNSNDNPPMDASGLLTNTFSVKDSGVYSLYARLICPNANDDSFWVKIDDGPFRMWNNISAATWKWIKFSADYHLAEGSHTLTIAYREDGAKMDKLWITRVDAIVDDEGCDAASCDIASAYE